MKMKKLLLTVCAVAMTCVANAATTYQAIAYLTPYTEKDSSADVTHAQWYSCYCLTQSDAQKAMSTTETVGYSEFSAWLADNFAENKTITIANAQQIAFNRIEKGNYTFEDNTSGTAAEDYLSDAIVVGFFANDDAQAYAVSENNSAFGNKFEVKIPTTKSKIGMTSWQAIPEPTSGLLLLLGMAGLALKRKQTKV